MVFDVMLVKEAENGYTARPLLWPDVETHGATQQEALEAVQRRIREMLGQTQFVQVEVDVPNAQTENPWLEKAGMFADDPTWNEFLQAMAEYRRKLENEDVERAQ
jgi:hypothetical protein